VGVEGGEAGGVVGEMGDPGGRVEEGGPSGGAGGGGGACLGRWGIGRGGRGRAVRRVGRGAGVGSGPRGVGHLRRALVRPGNESLWGCNTSMSCYESLCV